MATLHNVSTAKDGESFFAIGPVTIENQTPPQKANNGKDYSTVFIKSAGNEMKLMLWEAASLCKMPLGVEVTLRGKFKKEGWTGSPSLRCEEITPPEGAGVYDPKDVKDKGGKPKMKDCIDAGIRAVDYVVRKERPELSAAVFTFAANAFLQGVKIE